MRFACRLIALGELVRVQASVEFGLPRAVFESNVVKKDLLAEILLEGVPYGERQLCIISTGKENNVLTILGRESVSGRAGNGGIDSGAQANIS